MPSKVLIVDDERKIAKMVGSYLEASGFIPALAFDGAQPCPPLPRKLPTASSYTFSLRYSPAMA
jgi:DNA-binding response OmpR family regulator